jgi:DsbC/DsbD-like thiol-disulfide interchange protein
MRVGVLTVLVLVAVRLSGLPIEASQVATFGAADRQASGQRLATDHLDVQSGVSDEVVAPGSPFSVTLDIRPQKGIHVYAPGAKGYKIIAFNLTPNPLLVSRPTTYPSSEIYFFEPLNERVPVYQTPFRLSRRVTITTAAEHRAAVSRLKTLTIRGTLDYQACDDRLCFTPQSVPVSFSVTVKPINAGRAGTAPR